MWDLDTGGVRIRWGCDRRLSCWGLCFFNYRIFHSCAKMTPLVSRMAATEARGSSEVKMRRSELHFRLYKIITFFVFLQGKPASGAALINMWLGKVITHKRLPLPGSLPVLPFCPYFFPSASVPIPFVHSWGHTSAWHDLYPGLSWWHPQVLHQVCILFNSNQYPHSNHPFIIAVLYPSRSRHWSPTLY